LRVNFDLGLAMRRSLVQLLEASVQAFPDHEAIVTRERRLTYSQLWDQIQRVRQFLVGNGLQPGDRVAILFENSPEYVIAYYAGLAAQATVVGLNAATKSRELSNLIQHSGASWLMADATHGELQAVLALNPPLKALVFGQAEPPIHGTNNLAWEQALQTTISNVVASDVDFNQVAAVIYTSGTTGSPKGVMLTHRNLAANMRAIQAYLQLDSDDRALNVLPFHYAYGNSVLHTHLAVGGCLVLENSLMYPRKMLQLMVSEKATGFSGVPSTFALLLGRTKLADFDLSSLRYVTQAGGPMPPAKIREFRDLLPKARFFVMYGQTEATARLTYLPPEMLDQKLGSVGIPIPGVSIEVRKENGEVAAVGEVGEIVATGENISVGYWKDAEKSAQVFVAGWLRTGDLASRDEDGFLFIHGRSSDMIKTGAHRISPIEIEEVIAELPEVEEVAVIGLDDELLGQVIKAIIVPKAGMAMEKRKVLLHCKNNLPNYKVPKEIAFVAELPKTVSGKVQRFRLQ